jgi:type IV pilus assembly protein PilY1
MNFRDITAKGPFGPGNSNSKIVQFSSPISGIPAPFPSQIGQVADRIYVGDADGALWRIDLSGGKPQEWKAELAWDAYSLPGDGFQTGEPVQSAPVISTSPLGDTVILYSTGDQDLLSPSATMRTRLWSLKETRNAVDKTFDITESFFKDFTGGERVTGPMALFASVLYFSTFKPSNGAAACSLGGSAVWGIDYQTAAARFPAGTTGKFKEFELAPNTITFGVAVTQTPACAETSCEPDPFFGTSCSVNVVDGGEYQIVWHKGKGEGVTNNSQVKNSPLADGLQTLDVNPRQSTRIDSWAGIIE